MSPDKEVKIYGQLYRIKGDDPEKIEEVADYVNGMMERLLGGPGQGLSTKGAVLTALNIAEEWFSQKGESDKMLYELNERVDELLGILPE